MHAVSGVVSYILFSFVLASKNGLKLTCLDGGESARSSGMITNKVDDDTEIILEGCRGIHSLSELKLSWLSNGIYRKIFAEEFANLKILKITRSRIKRINFSLSQSLEVLALDENGMIDLPDFSSLFKLEKLFLSKNDFIELPKKNFANLELLKFMTLEENRICYIHSQAFVTNRNLRSLNLNRNDLQSLDKDLFSENELLVELCLNHNKLTSLPIDIFRNNLSLQTLRLHGNLLESLHKNLFSTNSNLKWIELGANRISFIDPKILNSLENLEFLDLTENACMDEAFPVNMNLEHMVELTKRNCHFIAAYYFEFI